MHHCLGGGHSKNNYIYDVQDHSGAATQLTQHTLSSVYEDIQLVQYILMVLNCILSNTIKCVFYN